MTPEEFERIAAVFEAARKLPSAERARLLDELCGAGTELRAHVLALLEEHDEGARGLGRPASERVETEGAEEPLPEVIAGFRIESKLGEGGFGVVYRARQESPIRRVVALKLLKPGMDSRRVLRRLEIERESLARMSHAAIARILEAGSTESGLPYFVLEYVPGAAITEYCAGRELALRDRLELFRRVCDAIEHAHQRGVIHRDIKPSNVLVADGEAGPEVKVIDFGIAKLLEHEDLEGTLLTREGQLVGTPAYMSPEQADLGGGEIDVRTDVYSLGVLLYEMITGGPPFSRETLRGASLSEVLRVIREVDPPRPSARAPGRLRGLRGDLDWIAMKALSKEKERRYPSVSALAADIDAHLRDEPVTATPPSVPYRARKFVRRHRLLVTSAAIVIVSLVAVVVAATVGLVETRRERRIAEERLGDVRDLATRFIFDFYDRIQNLDGATDAKRYVVETGLTFLDRLAEESGGRPDLLRQVAEAYLRLGNIQGNPTYQNVGDPAGARASYDRSRGIFAALRDADPTDAEARRGLSLVDYKLGQMARDEGRTADAIALLERSLELAREVASLRPDSERYGRDLGWSLQSYGSLLLSVGREPEGRRSLEEAYAIRSRLLAEYPESRDARRELVLSRVTLGRVLSASDTDAALEHFAAALTLADELVRDHPHDAVVARDRAVCLNQYGNLNAREGRHEEALRLYERMLEATRARADADPSDARARLDLAISRTKVGEALAMLGRASEALATLEEARSSLLRLAEEQPGLATIRRSLFDSTILAADMLVTLGRLAEAGVLHADALGRIEALEADNPAAPALVLDHAAALSKAAECHARQAREASGDDERVDAWARAKALYERSRSKHREALERGAPGADEAAVEAIDRRLLQCELELREIDALERSR